MVIPTGARQLGGAVRLGSVLVFALALFSSLLTVSNAGALPLPSVTAGLPLSNTPLAPVTGQLNNLTSQLPVPVTLTNTPGTIDAGIDLNRTPIVNQLPTPARPIEVSVPVPDIPPAATRAAERIMAPVAPASPNPQPLPRANLAAAPASSSAPSTPASEESQITTEQGPLAKVPFYSTVGNFIGSILPDAGSIVNKVTSKKIEILPIIISIALFALLLTSVVGITYLAERGNLFAGNGRFSQFAQTHDIGQLISLGVVLIGSAAISVYLALSVF